MVNPQAMINNAPKKNTYSPVSAAGINKNEPIANSNKPKKIPFL
jgi:hypothetical protein